MPRSRWVLIVMVVVALLVGYLLGGGGARRKTTLTHERGPAESEVLFWTCSMHPQIQQPGPGQCPICAMDLIPIHAEGTGGPEGPRTLTLSETAQKLAEIQTAPVQRKSVNVDLRMAGKVDYDETRLGQITAWVPGRIERLWVNFTGVEVDQGDPMVELYSPELLAAQEELLQASRAVEEMERRGTPGTGTFKATLNIVRNKLRLWGLLDDQIDDIIARGHPSERVTLHAPMGGVVVQKHATEGMYINTGMRLFAIADLSRVWIKLDGYESDLALISEGQDVEFEAEAYPGERFEGTIAFIDPVVDARSRTVKIRVDANNPRGRLKPEMFVRAAVHAQVPSEDGMVPLVIPASAALVTGKRAVVYVAIAGQKGAYEGREVVLGPRTGDYYVVREGLNEGEEVVTHGNFKIDSAIQILAKSSMMSPEGGVAPAGHHHGGAPAPVAGTATREAEIKTYTVPHDFRIQLDRVFSAYFDAHHALSHDVLDPARGSSKALLRALEDVDMGLLDGPAHMAWMEEMASLEAGAGRIVEADDIAEARTAFDLLSQSLIRAAQMFGTSGREPILLFTCSMAFDGRGAQWLQNKPGIENPYYGSAMFKCGEQLQVMDPGSAHSGHSHD